MRTWFDPRRCNTRADDQVRVRHIIDAADETARFIAGRTRDDLDSDRMLQFAVVRAIEIIGEAASKLSEETRSMAPSVPWRAIVGMRNRVVHAYFDVDNDVVWKAASEEIPALRAVLGELDKMVRKGGGMRRRPP